MGMPAIFVFPYFKGLGLKSRLCQQAAYFFMHATAKCSAMYSYILQYSNL